jgi:hypothetical protein
MSRFVPLSGVLAIVLIVVAVIVGGETPGTDDSLREIVSFYRENDQAGPAALFALGSLFFLIFVTTLWNALRAAEAERRGASTLALVGGTILVVGMTIFAGIGFTLGDAADDLTPAAIQALNALNSDLFFPLAVGNAAFLLGAGVSAVQTAALPKWLGWAAIVLGVFAATPLGFFAFLLMGLWSLIVSVILWRASAPGPANPGRPEQDSNLRPTP